MHGRAFNSLRPKVGALHRSYNNNNKLNFCTLPLQEVKSLLNYFTFSTPSFQSYAKFIWEDVSLKIDC